MVEFIESKLVRLRKEVDEMWELVRTQIDKSGNAVQNFQFKGIDMFFSFNDRLCKI